MKSPRIVLLTYQLEQSCCIPTFGGRRPCFFFMRCSNKSKNMYSRPIWPVFLCFLRLQTTYKTVFFKEIVHAMYYWFLCKISNVIHLKQRVIKYFIQLVIQFCENYHEMNFCFVLFCFFLIFATHIIFTTNIPTLLTISTNKTTYSTYSITFTYTLLQYLSNAYILPKSYQQVYTVLKKWYEV